MELLILIVVISVVAVATIGFVVGSAVRRRPRRTLTGGGTEPRLPAAGDDGGQPRPGAGGIEGGRASPPAAGAATIEPAPAAPGAAPQVEGEAPTPAPAAAVEGVAAPVPPRQRPPVETPAPAAGRLVRLRLRLSRSQSALGRGLLSLLSGDRLDEETWEDVEATLLVADVGVTATSELVAALRERTKVLGASGPDQARAMLRDELLAQVGTTADRSLRTSVPDRPAVVLVVGVNGTGKTTTCGKIARLLVADGRTVVLGAADTFRAAAADQLQTWGERVGAETVRGAEGGDPASVAFDAVKRGIESRADTVLIDTAGRLHTKTGLMDELAKIKRVVGKHGPVDEVLLVLDATTGQNALVQARVFTEAVELSGVVLTKLDGTAKGGIVIAVQRELGIPVKLIGLGEGPDDLAPFEPEAFVDALLGEPA
ncbi:Signal recognition particle receptor FtsY [Frankia canadensis]|uniref:Signal recognition particle receptor FtsY n=1 Tax=Frankia canadensis TaxID=1836972 RepID=A0A2I2KQD6_9ACTN|nr:signal recognition particle-docking protein FtsY [Frankia canadensis]SNQ47846.1 Signal recognition particle receptor FtsY [Frankia canadensis]SOU55136.1 Signal recognition particle receptor FtsY [Frankia canadensis]